MFVCLFGEGARARSIVAEASGPLLKVKKKRAIDTAAQSTHGMLQAPQAREVQASYCRRKTLLQSMPRIWYRFVNQIPSLREEMIVNRDHERVCVRVPTLSPLFADAVHSASFPQQAASV